jgi:catechol 2,3-dioxygenase-like lactoylglutathione lyase family enzyme
VIDGLHTTWAQVADMDRAVAFYRDVLGLKPVQVSPHWSEFELSNGRIGLHPPLSAKYARLGAPSGWFLGLRTSDVRGLKARLDEHQVFISDGFHQTPAGVVLTFADPDGNPIQAMEVGAKLEEF